MEKSETLKCTEDRAEINKMYWNEFYRNVKIQEESPFCEFLKQQITKDFLILDVGCGSGRDSFSFSRDGYEVVGIDRSLEAIQYTNNLKEKFWGDNIYFKVVDINNKPEFEEIVGELSKKAHSLELNLMVYLRFVIHAIDSEAEKVLLSTLSSYLKEGDYIAAEFRTIEDQNQKKIYDKHYRRYIDAEKFLLDLKEVYKFEKVLFQKGTGLAVFNEEDPYICRIIAEKQ